MAIAFRSAASVTNATAGTSVTVAKPAGTADGDMLIAFVTQVGTGSIAAPAGWTLVGSQASSSNMTAAAYWKLAASEGASWTWTLGASVRNIGWVGAYTGVNTTNPVFDSEPGTTLSGSITVLTGKVVALPHFWQIHATAAVRTASGTGSSWLMGADYSERLDSSTNAGAGTDISAVVGDRAFTAEFPRFSTSPTASQSQTAGVNWLLMLRPAFTAYDGGLIEPITEIEINGAWEDISAYVRNSPPATITKGRSSSAGVAAPTRISLTLDNEDGRFTEDNPTGAYYPYFQPGVRLRVSVPFGYDPPTERATAFIDSLEPDWDISTSDAIVNVTASGRLRRLQRGETPLLPALQRSIGGSGGLGVMPAEYWTFQDESGSTQVASAVGGLPISPSGLSFASDSTLPGSGTLAKLSTGASLYATMRPHADVGHWIFGVFLKIPASPGSDTALVHVQGSGGIAFWKIELIAGSPDSLRVTAYNSSVVSLGSGTTAITEADMYGRWCLFTLSVVQDGADVDFTANFTNGTSGSGAGNTVASAAAGTATGWSITPAAAALDNAGIGHAFLIAHADFDPTSDYLTFGSAMDGYDPELPLARVQRLAAEEGEPLQSIVVGDTSIFMGPQPDSTLVDAARECEDVDQGLLHDGGPDGDLMWIMRATKYNADVRMTLDKASGQIAPPFRPVRDDQMIRNDWTVSRRGGSSARHQQLTGSMSVNPRPDGVGRYANSRSLNLSNDAHLALIAQWRVAEGTATAKRYPVIAGDLRMSPELAESWLNCRIAARIKAINLMSQHPASIDADVFIEGYTEHIATDVWRFGINSSPAAPYVVGVLDDDNLGKNDTAGTELVVARSTSDTSWTVHTTIPPKWTTDSGEMPIPLTVAGEVLSCTAIANVTPAFVAAGTVAHGNNASVQPALPAGLAAGDLLLVWCAIRNSGTGTPNTPTGYTLLADCSNARLFGKYAASGEAAPTIGFTGGAANADTSAQTAAFRGVGLTVHNSATQLNSSAQNIAYPALLMGRDNCLVLYLGWKQDDWTSVAAVAGATEIGEPDTTTGDDQGIVWDYLLQGARANIAAASFTVTGGASAISRGAVVALASDVQTMTVTRSVNDVVKAQVVGAAINVHEPARAAL